MKALVDRLLSILETHLQFERDLRTSYLDIASREIAVKEYYATKPNHCDEPF